MGFGNLSAFSRHFFATNSLQASDSGVKFRRIAERVQSRIENNDEKGEKMMTTKRISFVLAAAALMFVLIAGLNSRSSVRAGGGSAPNLEGSWNVVVGPGSPTEFRTLTTYAAGGGLMATAPVVPPPFHASTAHGTWERTGGHQFTYTFLALLYNPTGHFAGTLKVRETITLDNGGDQYDGTSSVEVFDPFGNVVPAFSSCGGTSHGTRINVEPPPCL